MELDFEKTLEILRSNIMTSFKSRLENVSIYVYTSHFEGLGTNRSDIDVYVFCNTIPELLKFDMTFPKSMFVGSRIGNENIDTEYWRNEIFVSTAEHYVSDDNYFDPIIAKVLLRLEKGVCLKQGFVTDFISTGDYLEVNHRKIGSYFRNEAVSDIWDATALLNSGELIPALDVSRKAVLSALAYNNAEKGFPSLNMKWFSKIFLEKTDVDSSLRSDYHKLLFSCVTVGTIEKRIDENLEFTQNLLSSTLF